MAYALVTGASGGIGLSLAHALAKRKVDVLLVARSADKLQLAAADIQEKYQVKAAFLALDLSLSGSSQVVKDWVTKNGFSVNILVNNAGYGLWGTFDEMPWPQLANMMQLNMVAMAELCHTMIPELKRNGPSYVMNIASTAAYQAVPTLATYAATKSFVVLFSRGLRMELRGSGISVTCVSPGATATQFVERAGMSNDLKQKAEKFSMSADDVARVAINGMFNRKAEVVPGFVNWLSVQFTYLLPKLIPEAIAASLYKEKV